MYLIHDNAVQFNLDYLSYSIKGIATSIMAPNMNSIAERFVKSARVEALDYFLLLNRKQIKGILKEYISYYNNKRPHQGIDQKVPKNYKPQKEGNIFKLPILSGLHHHYFREAA